MAAEAVAWRPVLHGRERPILQGGLGAREGVTKAQMQERGEGAGMTVSSACWPATGVRVAVRGSTYQPPLSAQSAKGNLYAPPANEGCHYQHSCELSEGLSALAFHFYVNLLSHGSRLPHTHTVHSLQITVCWPSRFHILPDATHTKMKNRSDLIRTSRRQCFSGRGIQLAGRNPASPNVFRLTVCEHDPFGPSKIVRYYCWYCIQARRRDKGRHALSRLVSLLLALLLTHNPARRVPSGGNVLLCMQVLRYSALCASSH